MNLRTGQARWFELLVSHDDLSDTLEALAHTGSIELELQEHTHLSMDLQDLQLRLQNYTTLQRYYRYLWPKPDTAMSPFTGSPADILDKALSCIYQWEQRAQPEAERLAIAKSQLDEIHILQTFLGSDDTRGLDCRLLSATTHSVAARLFLLPAKGRLENVPETVISRQYQAGKQRFLLLLGVADELDALSAELVDRKFSRVQVPSLPGSRIDAIKLLAEKREQLESSMLRLQHVLDALSDEFHLAQALGEISKLDWFIRHVPSLPVSSNFAWITGWTSDRSGNRLRQALDLQGSRALLHFPDAPEGIAPPLLLQNPWWARPFEIFATMLGTPGSDEADPSRLLAIMAPLLFGYMFADVGQGLILFISGLLLQRRWPLLRILIANGISAMLFGFIFGSLFGREDLIPALWLHPLSQPLPVLAVPLFAGVFIILLGLALSAAESRWRGEWLRWLQVDVPVILLYLSVISLFFIPQQAVAAIVVALLWYLTGNFMRAQGRILAVLVALGSLLETMLQLFLNTVSFARVGAFALAHAGLSMAFSIMADSSDSVLMAVLLMLLGNMIVIVLEGLVVSIQTTRLILFEFFIRFLQANGRVFKPLSAPVAKVVTG